MRPTVDFNLSSCRMDQLGVPLILEAVAVEIRSDKFGEAKRLYPPQSGRRICMSGGFG